MQRIAVKLWSLSLLILFLSGCLPILLVAVGASAGGAVIYDKRTTKVMLQDQEIDNKAVGNLNSDMRLKDKARVSVSTFNHVVLMVGQAQSEEVRQYAYEDVSKVPQVKRVYNQVQISPLLTTWDQSKDAWITSKVKTAMMAKPGLSSSQIKVVTENKVVYLMGLVTPGQAKLATEAARHVSGVTRVVQVFEYES